MTDTNINKEAIEPAEVLEVKPSEEDARPQSEWDDKSAEAAQRSPFYEIAQIGRAHV